MTRRRPRTLRTSRRSSHGQVVPIVALIAVVLFAATGLAVDAGLAYFAYNGSERAAASAALAGVPYMPSGIPVGTFSSTTCVGTAGAAACAATARDGLANGSTVNGHPVTVTVARFPSGCGAPPATACADNKLTVQVTSWVQPTFLHVLGFGDHQVTASDTAFFLPPIALGQPGAQLGSSEDQLGTANSFYFLRSEGYANDRSEGDAYDPYNTKVNITSCTVNPESTASVGTSTDVHTLSANLGTDVSDSTLTGGGFNKLPEAGGYDFSVNVPTTVPSAYAMVYNPSFAPDGGFNPVVGSPYNMHEQDTSFTGNTYTDQYSAMEYTLFQVNDKFDHSSDTPLSQVVVDPLNVTITGGAVTSMVDVANGQTLPPAVFNYVLANVYHKWVDMGTPPVASTQWGTHNIFHVFKNLPGGSLAPGSYRLRADMLDYQGLRPGPAGDPGASQCTRAHKGYAVQLATSPSSSGALCADPGCQVAALDELAVYTPITASPLGFSIPLFNLPADYAGQTINFYIFDVGDVTGANSISIQNPDATSCGASPAPCLFTTSTGVKVYDLGADRSTSLTGNLLAPNGPADACASPALQPDGTQALVNTTPIGGTCGRPSNFFNGRWLLFQLQIPSNYTGAGGAYWQMHYSCTGTASDTFTLAVNYANSPVHLL